MTVTHQNGTRTMMFPAEREPKIIPADEAEQMLQGITSTPWRFGDGWSLRPFSVDEDEIEYNPRAAANATLAEAAPDLAHTVVQQAKRIRELEHKHSLIGRDLLRLCC